MDTYICFIIWFDLCLVIYTVATGLYLTLLCDGRYRLDVVGESMRHVPRPGEAAE